MMCLNYKIMKNKKVKPKSRKCKAKKEEISFEDKWDSWARKRSAWSEYAATMHAIRMNDDLEYREEQKKKPNRMYIG